MLDTKTLDEKSPEEILNILGIKYVTFMPSQEFFHSDMMYDDAVMNELTKFLNFPYNHEVYSHYSDRFMTLDPQELKSWKEKGILELAPYYEKGGIIMARRAFFFKIDGNPLNILVRNYEKQDDRLTPVDHIKHNFPLFIDEELKKFGDQLSNKNIDSNKLKIINDNFFIADTL